MKELTIGYIIKYQINKKSILPEKLTEGLCTTTSLKRLINGDTRQSFFLVERKLHMQYVLETRGVILSEGYGKHEEALELYHKAFKTVLERFEVDRLSDFL